MAFAYKWYILVSILGSAVYAVFNMLTIASFSPFLTTLFSDSETAARNLHRYGEYMGRFQSTYIELVDKYMLQDRVQALIILFSTLFAITFCKGCAKFVVEYCTGMITNSTVLDLQNRLFAHMMDMHYAFYQKTGIAQLISRFTNDMEHVYKGLKTISGKSFTEPFKIMAVLFYCLWASWKLTLISLLVIPVIGIGVVWIGKYSRRKGRRMLVAKGELVSIMQQAFDAIRIVKVFRAEEQEKDAFKNENKTILRENMKVVKAQAFIAPVMELVGIFGIASVVVIGYRSQVMTGNMMPQDFATFYVAIYALIDPIRKLGNVNSRIQSCAAGADRVFEYLDAPVAIRDEAGAQVLTDFNESLRWDGLGFQYLSDSPVLSEISVTLPKGKTLAVVGPSGAGKSTLVNLLPRFYDPVSGCIRLDEKDIRSFTLASLRDQIGIVTQETLLFDDTIRFNIAYGQANQVNEAKLIQAAKAANAHEFILGLPKGYDTIIGEKGTTLSGGQRQRVAIARAIYKDPAILILDEATSSLDTENERVIQAVLDEFMKNRTTIVIAHRLSTIQNADMIMVLESGRMESLGTHEELLHSSQTYQRLYHQFAPDQKSKTN